MPKVSVIVPVYQGENFIEAGLSALCAQTLGDIEIVCVNDGSTDNSSQLLSSWAARDPRIKLIETANRGLSAARNTGINAASGDYLMFMDVDDKLLPTACERISAVFEQTGAEIVTFGASCDPPEAAEPWLQECLSPRDVSYSGFDTRLLFKENSRPYACRTAVSAAFLQRCGLRFEEGIAFGEDQIFHFMAYPAARRTELISDKLYSYRLQVESSLTATRRDDVALRISEHIRLAELILSGWQERGWLEQHKAIMLSWALEFVTLDIFRLEYLEGLRLLGQLRGLLDDCFGLGDMSGLSGMDSTVNATDLGGPPVKLPFWTRRLLHLLCRKQPEQLMARKPWPTITAFYLQQRGIAKSLSRLLAGGLGSR